MPIVRVKLTFTQTEISFDGTGRLWVFHINPEETLSLMGVFLYGGSATQDKGHSWIRRITWLSHLEWSHEICCNLNYVMREMFLITKAVVAFQKQMHPASLFAAYSMCLL